MCCAALQVRREGFYDWRKRPSKETRDEPLLAALKVSRLDNPGYGTQSLIDTLPEGLRCSYGKGYKLCRDNNLLCYRVRRPHGNTKRDPEATAIEGLVCRDFQSDKPGTKWFTDITEWQCSDGKAYLCGVLDAFDGALLGHAIDSNMRAPLCTGALMRAERRFGHSGDCIVHGDHGSQFTSHLYRETIAAHGFRLSMGAVGHCADNARMESFWATLKKELISCLRKP